MVTDKNGPQRLTARQIRAVFGRHHGAASDVARGLGIHVQSVYDFLKGRGRSERVETAVRQRASELLKQEQE